MTTVQPPVSQPISARPSVAAKRATPTRETWHRAAWRWHFYAGMVVGPILFIVAATGALYIFKDEIEFLLYPGLFRVAPSSTRARIETVTANAAAHIGAGRTPNRISIESNPARSLGVSFFGKEHQPYRHIYVNPYSGHVLGELPNLAFFPFVLRLHRQLFMGTTGRIIVELTTCWTLILLGTGAYLWWPRRWSRLSGVLWPR